MNWPSHSNAWFLFQNTSHQSIVGYVSLKLLVKSQKNKIFQSNLQSQTPNNFSY